MPDTALPVLTFPRAQPPEPGEVVEIAPGILWMRLALPWQLNHVNIYLLEDEGGWAVLDTGLGDAPTRTAWTALLQGPLAGRRLTRLIATHYHPDHVGLAGWMAEQFGLPLHMSQAEYLLASSLQFAPDGLEGAARRAYYLSLGLAPEAAEQVAGLGHRYLRITTGVPLSYRRLMHGDTFRVGGREFAVRTGGGHSLEQVMLLGAANGLFLAADQVMPRISPNVSVSGMEPEADPLGLYLRSLAELRAELAEDVLALPGHHLPFRGVRTRIEELVRHHAARCADIARACRAAPLTPAEIVPVIFPRPLDAHQRGFAIGEVMAHVNRMLREGRLRREDEGGVMRLRAV